MKFLFKLVIIVLISLLVSPKRRVHTEAQVVKMHLEEFEQNEENIQHEIFSNEKTSLKHYGAIYIEENSDKFIISDKKIEGKVLLAECYFHKTITNKGWDKISINTYKEAKPYQQAFFAGYLEGRMTSEDIYNFYNNLKVNNAKSKPKSFQKLLEFFNEITNQLAKKVKNLKNLSSLEEKKYWSQLVLAYTQLEGIYKGYTYEITKNNQYEQRKMTMADFLILQADGEVPELLRYFHSLNKQTKPGDKNYFKKAFGINTTDPVKFWGELMWTSKCSAFIKLVKDENGNWKDLLAGHTTWSEYYEMLRIFKHYKFELENNGTFKKSEIIFSSYPGAISSTDDFYITHNNLLITETTLEVIDINLYHKHVKPVEEYIPNFMRVMAASRAAKSAEEWVKLFKFNKSGTYSSQWMVLDYNVFEKIKDSNKQANGLLYMMEETPSSIVSHDISKHLFEHQYFGSFNRAFLEDTKNDLNTALINHLYGSNFDYDGANRGKIFHTLQNEVKDLESLKNILRYNGYKKNVFQDDPSNDDPSHGISARFDLSLSTNNLSGGVDCKITNYELTKKMTCIAISGPTNDNNENLPPFEWNKVNSKDQRKGVPDKFNFPYIIMSPKTICCDNQNDIYKFKQ